MSPWRGGVGSGRNHNSSSGTRRIKVSRLLGIKMNGFLSWMKELNGGPGINFWMMKLNGGP